MLSSRYLRLADSHRNGATEKLETVTIITFSYNAPSSYFLIKNSLSKKKIVDIDGRIMEFHEVYEIKN